MPKAHEVASELRKLADSLEREPDAAISQPLFTFYEQEKNSFLAAARSIPHPVYKERDGREIVVTNWKRNADGLRDYSHPPVIWIRAKAEQEKVCRIVKPAVPAIYECEPLLSEAEESALETAVAE